MACKPLNSKLFVLVLFLFLFYGFPVSAQIVTCEGLACNTWCAAFGTMQNIFNFLIELAFVLAAALIVWGGVMMVISQGNPGNVNRAKEIITMATWGLVIVLIAWLVINTILVVGANLFWGAGYDFSNWWNLNC